LRRISALTRFVVVIGLLILPALAVLQTGWDLLWVGAYAVVMSGITYLFYAADKRRAQGGVWRVPEAHLHFLELLGEWPGGFLAQGHLRHKCSKVSYQVSFWLIVLLWQFVAFDFLQNWAISKAMFVWADGIRQAVQHP
jgi:uncharacterized membrane protein YsdA (DUF1294 family)